MIPGSFNYGVNPVVAKIFLRDINNFLIPEGAIFSKPFEYLNNGVNPSFLALLLLIF